MFVVLLDLGKLQIALQILHFDIIQGISSGFDIMNLALTDRNMQVRFGSKVVWES